MIGSHLAMPAQAGIQAQGVLGPGLRRDDENRS